MQKHSTCTDNEDIVGLFVSPVTRGVFRDVGNRTIDREDCELFTAFLLVTLVVKITSRMVFLNFMSI